MAETTGLIQRLKWNAAIATMFVEVGPSATSTDLFFLSHPATDSQAVRGSKANIAYLLTQAQLRGYEATVGHAEGGSEVEWVRLGPLTISPVGEPVHQDFFAVSGSVIPADASLVFEQGPLSISVVPDLIRPHLVFVSQLPTSVPVGDNLLRIESSTWISPAVPVRVSAGPPLTVRLLYSGDPKDRPYTIAVVANAAIEAAAGGSFATDPVLTNRPAYHTAVSYCLQNLFAVTEDLLRASDLDAHFRIVSVFDNSLPAVEANSLAHEINPNLMETRRVALAPFLSRYQESADIVLVLHGSTTHTRATAWFTSDDATSSSTPFTYDGAAHVHGHVPSIPGSAAIPLSVDTTGLTAFHEFGHAASDFVNGKVVDLYVDGSPGGFQVNKKFRASATDAVPASFATYNAASYGSDSARDGLGYPSTWKSYHPSLIDPSRPNAMDNYWFAFDDPLFCRLDQLTYDFLRDRVTAKVFR